MCHHRRVTTNPDGTVPLISIGVPAYNAEAFLGPALESLLGQTFQDLEVVVSDNCSTDGTERICRELAARDARLRYVRQEVNRGGAANFNAVFALRHPGATYFKWAAADDVHEPGYLTAVLGLLTGDSSVSVAHSQTVDVDEQGNFLRSWGNQDLPADHRDVAVRFAALSQRNYQCFSIFGLVRADVLAGTRGLGYYAESDRVLLAELSLRGRLADVPEVLFHRRQHAGRSVRTFPTARDRIAWFNPELVGRPVFPEWRLGREFFGAVLASRLPWQDRARCGAQMARWAVVRGPHLARNVLRTTTDLLSGHTSGRSRSYLAGT